MSNPSATTGILLVGHGTRDETGTRQFLELAEVLKDRLAPAAVEAAFLELREPGIGVGVERLVARGTERLVTVPLLLFAAGHIKRDVPGEVEKALVALGRGDLERAQAGHLGCHAALLELSKIRMEEAGRGRASGYGVPRGDPGNEENRTIPSPPAPLPGVPGRGEFVTRLPALEEVVGTAHPTCLLLVARGSKDEEASAEMRRFAALRQEEEPDLMVEVAFLAMARPSLEEQLIKVAAAGYRCVVVQPHFLFEGELVERIRGQIGEMARKHPETEWLAAPPLADRPGEAGLASELLTKVILDRCQEAGFVLS